jgi:Domain of unknown function (DUF1992)
MHWIDAICERRAREAAEHGQLNGLPGEGKPLDLSEDLIVPAEVRTILHVLKNAGYAPPEIEQLRAIARAEKELAALPESDRTARAKALVTKIAMLREGGLGKQ